LNAAEAKEYGLVHEIKTGLIPPNAEIEVVRVGIPENHLLTNNKTVPR